jgi:hypothetical protein
MANNGQYVVLTAVGPDRPGLVSEISGIGRAIHPTLTSILPDPTLFPFASLQGSRQAG